MTVTFSDQLHVFLSCLHLVHIWSRSRIRSFLMRKKSILKAETGRDTNRIYNCMTCTRIGLLSCGSTKTRATPMATLLPQPFRRDAAISRKAARGNPWDSSVGMATGYGLAGWCSISDRVKKFRLVLGSTRLSIQWVYLQYIL
jgi:hypothetical protein